MATETRPTTARNSELTRSSRLLVFTIFVLTLPLAGQSFADVVVEGETTCFDHEQLKVRLSSVLGAVASRNLQVHVQAADLPDGTEVGLTIHLPDGEVALTRQYRLTPSDCASSSELIVIVVSRFLEELPAETWTTPTAKPTVVVAAQVSLPEAPVQEPAPSPPLHFDYVLGTGLLLPLEPWASQAAPLTTEFELALGAALHSQNHTFSGVALLRQGLSQSIGGGNFRVTGLLSELEWTQHRELHVGVALRGGSLRVAGSEFDENFTKWLPWVEGGALVGYQWKQWSIRAQVLLSPLRHQIRTQDRQHSLSIPRLRASLGLRWYFGAKKS